MAEELTYTRYLHLSDLTSLQCPQSSPPCHDELLFIVTHQVYELWFKLLLHELDAVNMNLAVAANNARADESLYEAGRLLRRCTEILHVLVEQFTILETMLPTHFLAFRQRLAPASGSQSEQFVEIEFVCGVKDDKKLRPFTPDAQTRLARRLQEPSLRDVFFKALMAHVTPSVRSNPETKAEYCPARIQAVLTVYRDESRHRVWIELCERLAEFDELMTAWRLRHIQMVERVIGLRPGTGGSDGVSYLKATLEKRFFPELWEARSLMAVGPSLFSPQRDLVCPYSAAFSLPLA